MAKKFLVSIDLNQNELQKAVVHALATAPASGATGQIYFNTADKKLYQWYDNTWNVVGREYSEATTSVSGLMSASDKTKLNGIASGAEVNVQSDWNQTDTDADDYIKNKPTIPPGSVVDSSFSTTSTNALQNKVITLELQAIDISASYSGGTATIDISSGESGQVSSSDTFTIPEATTSASGLMSSTDKTALANKADGNGRIFYGTCSTAASTAAKVVTCSDYDQIGAGDIILVSFTYPNTASNPTLNVNSTGAKSLVQMYRGDYSTSQTGLKNPSSVRGLSMFVFSANKWVLVGANDWETYGAGTQSGLEEGVSTVNLLWSSKILHDYIASVVGGVDAMRFKGTVNSNSDLPTTGVKVGDTYMVNTAGTYAGQTCEVGDLIIATATTPTWTVAQTNIDGAVTASSTTSNGYLAKFTGNKTVANGPQLGSGTTTYLRNDGTWATPPGTYTLPSASKNLGGMRSWCETIYSGNTSVTSDIMATQIDLCSVCATDGTTKEEVVVDVGKDSNGYLKFSINASYNNNIYVNFTYLNE